MAHLLPVCLWLTGVSCVWDSHGGQGKVMSWPCIKPQYIICTVVSISHFHHSRTLTAPTAFFDISRSRANFQYLPPQQNVMFSYPLHTLLFFSAGTQKNDRGFRLCVVVLLNELVVQHFPYTAVKAQQQYIVLCPER